MERLLRIAFTGVFDLENYGDHLFPEVFKDQMSRRGIECELILFSVFSGRRGFGLDEEIFSVKDMERMHEEKPFDAIVVGGGDIIHTELYEHDWNGEHILYPIYDLWIIPSELSAQKNILLLWNAPGVPFDFEGASEYLARKMLNSVSYIAVRNEASKKALSKIGMHDVFVVPDTALSLKDTYDDQRVEMSSLLLEDKKYIVVHISRLIPKVEIQELRDVLQKMSEKLGLEVIGLPLAYTNRDNEVLRDFVEEAEFPVITFDRELSISEIVTVLSAAELYIGFSYHGAITACLYGARIVSYNYTNNRKTADLFAMLDIPECCVVHAQELEEAINSSRPVTEIRIRTIISAVYAHFDEMALQLRSGQNDARSADEEKPGLSRENSYIGEVSLERQRLQRKIHIANQEIAGLRSEIADRDRQIAELRCMIDTFAEREQKLCRELDCINDSWVENSRMYEMRIQEFQKSITAYRKMLGKGSEQ